MSATVRAIALVAAHNERRFIATCLENLIGQGFSVYLLDHGSTDGTAEIASRYLGRGLLEIEPIPRGDGVFRLGGLLRRKEELSRTLDADWFLHCDPDEVRLPPRGQSTLAETLADAEARGFNAINFNELTFVPTVLAPDHDHGRFVETMRWYYAFEPRPNYRVTLWKRCDGGVRLAESGGHYVQFPGRAIYPRCGRLKHYPFLSVGHAIEKYGGRRHDPEAVAQGFHGWRARLAVAATGERPELLQLPRESELRRTSTDGDLDPSNPRTRHCWLEAWAERVGDAKCEETAIPATPSFA